MDLKLVLRTQVHDHPDAIHEVGIHCGNKFFFARSEHMLVLYDLQKGAKLQGFYDSAGYSAAAFSSDGNTLMYMSDDRVHHFDIPSWQERMAVVGELKELRDSDANLGLGMWAIAEQGGAIELRSIGVDEDAPPEFVLDGKTAYVEFLKFHPSGKLLASGAGDQTLRFWDISSKSIVYTQKIHDDIATAVAFSPDGKIMVSGDYSGLVRVWDLTIS